MHWNPEHLEIPAYTQVQVNWNDTNKTSTKHLLKMSLICWAVAAAHLENAGGRAEKDGKR